MSFSQPGRGVPPPPPDLPPATRTRRRASAPGVAALLVVTVLALAAATAILAGNPTASPTGSDAATQPALAGSSVPAGTADGATHSPGQTADDASPGSSLTAGATATPVAAPPRKQPAPTSAPPEELTGYLWPLHDARITSRFGPRGFGGFVVIDGEEIHDGLDLATYCGNKVRAAHDGRVLHAGRHFDDYMGYLGSGSAVYQRLERQGRINTLPIVVVIDDGNGYRSVYVHLSKANVEAGDVVRAGDVIGLEGATGYSTGCHLHYTLIRMDGPWQVVLPQLHPFGYPAFARERVDPLDVLPRDHPDAPARLRARFGSPSPEVSPAILPPATPATPPPDPSASPSAAVSP